MSVEIKECATEITPWFQGRKGTAIHCKEPRVKGTLFCARHQHSMSRVYLATQTMSEYDYYRTNLDRFNSQDKN